MPSYLSSTQTSGPEPGDDLRGVLGRRGEHELERMEQRQRGVAELVVAGEAGQPPDVADEHARPLDVVERAVEGLRDGGLDEALAQADPEVAAEHLDDVLGRQRVGPLEERRAGWPTCGPARRPARSRRTRRPPRGASGSSRAAARGRRPSSTSATAMPRSDERSYASPSADRGTLPRSVTVDAMADQPSPAARWSASAKGRPVRKTAAIGQLVGRDRSEVVGQDGRLLGGPGGRREALGELAPATHAGMVYRARDGAETVVPGGADRLAGRPPAARAGEHRRVPALVRGPRDRPAGALPGDADATRGDRALLRGAGPRAPTRWRWPSTRRRPTG